MTTYVDNILTKTGLPEGELKAIKWRAFYYVSIPILAMVSVALLTATLVNIVSG